MHEWMGVMADPSTPYTIVCFGDSLTAGYQSPTPDVPESRETPYGTFLQEMLGARASVAVSGVCGELTAEMAMRFRQDVLAHSPSYVVILGGTNDLGWNARPAEIVRNLLKMYETARAARVEPVAVTVPSIRIAAEAAGGEGASWIWDHITRRHALNKLISDYCDSQSVACVDLFKATAEPETQYLASAYSNDGLHLTTEGYRRLAGLLYDQVFRTRL